MQGYVHMRDSGHNPEWSWSTVERIMRNGTRIYVSASKSRLVEQALRPAPDGQVKFPHPWPPQIPPGRTAGL
jgi:hypothetical protein